MSEMSTAELLGRIDERTHATGRALTALDVKIDGYGERLGRVESALESFAPVKKVVYAAIGMILTALLLAVIALVTVKPWIIKERNEPTQHSETR